MVYGYVGSYPILWGLAVIDLLNFMDLKKNNYL